MHDSTGRFLTATKEPVFSEKVRPQQFAMRDARAPSRTKHPRRRLDTSRGSNIKRKMTQMRTYDNIIPGVLAALRSCRAFSSYSG